MEWTRTSPGCAISFPLNFQQLFLEWVQTSNNYMRRTTNSRRRQCLCGLRRLRGYTKEDRQCHVWKTKGLSAGEIRTKQVSFIGTLSVDSKGSKESGFATSRISQTVNAGYDFVVLGTPGITWSLPLFTGYKYHDFHRLPCSQYHGHS